MKFTVILQKTMRYDDEKYLSNRKIIGTLKNKREPKGFSLGIGAKEIRFRIPAVLA